MTQEAHPLVTAIILNIHHDDSVFVTIDSILKQDYPNIELLICCNASAAFDRSRLEAYTAAHQQGNVRRVKIFLNEGQRTITEQLDVVRAEEMGDYELLITAGDCWAFNGVFTAFADRFRELGPEAEVIVSQINICEGDLSEISQFGIPVQTVEALRSGSMTALTEQLLTQGMLPGFGSACRRSFFEQLGHLSEDYAVTTSGAAQLRWLRMGKRFHYLDRITLLHLNAISPKTPLYTTMIGDRVTLFEKEIAPYEDSFSPAAFSRAAETYENDRECYLNRLHPITVYFRHFNGNKESWNTLTSILNQRIEAVEIIIGCIDSVDPRIDRVNKERLDGEGNPAIRRVQLVTGLEELPDAQYTDALRAKGTNDCALWLDGGDTFVNDTVLRRYVVADVCADTQPFDREAFLRENIQLATPAQSTEKTPRGTRALRSLLPKGNTLLSFSHASRITRSLAALSALTVITALLKTDAAAPHAGFLPTVALILAVAEGITVCLRIAVKLILYIEKALKKVLRGGLIK